MSKLEMSGFEQINTPLIPLGNGDATNSGCRANSTGHELPLPGDKPPGTRPGLPWVQAPGPGLLAVAALSPAGT